nr:MAG TPA: hypothetical protein [Crassvirales sp.]DAK71313.1 MAG TPA: hypothetical protein [Caudoviricetes sp.]
MGISYYLDRLNEVLDSLTLTEQQVSNNSLLNHRLETFKS